MWLKRGHVSIAFVLVANVMLAMCCCCCGGVGNGDLSSGGVSSVAEADREFQKAASKKGERQGVAAKMLIDFRRDDNWPWSQIEDEVDFQFGSIRDEFNQWKRNCIRLGDD